MEQSDGWRAHNLEVFKRSAKALMNDCALSSGEILGIWPVTTSLCDYTEKG